jgi:NAD(P)H-dependent FMN reductase
MERNHMFSPFSPLSDDSDTDRVIIVSGSPRRGSQSRRIAEEVAWRAANESPEWAPEVIDLAEATVPEWDESLQDPDSTTTETWLATSRRLARASAFVFVVPEWSGMAPPCLKNLFLMCNRHELAHKPALLVGISAGAGGSYPISELRASSYKNTRVIYIPDHVVIRHVGDALRNPTPESEHLDARLRYSLAILRQYAFALRSVRQSRVVDLETYPFGM